MSRPFTSATDTANSDRPQQSRDVRLTLRNRTRKRPTTKLAICSYNARTLRTQADLDMLLHSLKRVRYDVVALQETKRSLEYHQKLDDGTEIRLGSRDPNHPVGGIGFIVAPHIVPCIDSLTITSHRIGSLILKIGKRSRMQIVCTYAPTSDASDEIHEEFLEELRVVVRDQSIKFRVMLGDWNAKLGKKRDPTERMGPYGFGDRNEAGERLLEVIEELRMFHANSLFRKKEERKWTWRSPNNAVRNEIDHAFVSHRQMTTDFDVVSPFCTGSDHRLIRLRLQLSDDLYYAASRKTFGRSIELDSGRVRELMDRFLPVAATSYEAVEKTIADIQRTASRTSPSHQERRISESTRRLLQKRSLLSLDPDSHLEMVRISKLCRQKMEEDLTEYRAQRLREAAEGHRSIKKTSRKLCQGRDIMAEVLDPDGITVTSRSAIERTVRDFYTELYKKDFPPGPPRPISPSDHLPAILPSEVRLAIEQLQSGRAPGKDRITSDILKCGGHVLHVVLADQFTIILHSGRVPDAWKLAILVLLHKKGDKKDLANWRPIALLSQIYKIFSKVLLNRIRRQLDEQQPVEQAAFRRGFGCSDHIHAISQVVERSREHRLPLVVVFVDFLKAFDMLDHEYMLQTLVDFGIDEGIVSLIQNCYKDSSLSLKIFSKELHIPVHKGVRQGDTISPALFTAALERAIRQLDWERRGIRVDGRRLHHLRFADDVVLFATNPAEATDMLAEFKEACGRAGLKINVKKTQYMTTPVTPQGTVLLDQIPLEKVDSYVYLGRAISCSNTMEAEISRRIRAGWAAYHNVKETLTALTDQVLRAQIFDSCVLPALCYATETWALTKRTLDRIRIAHKAMERRLMGISLFRQRELNISSEQLRSRSLLRDPIEYIHAAKHRWAGHVARRDDGRWTRAVTDWYPRDVRRPRGRPPRRWADSLRASAQTVEPGSHWSTVARDRLKWKMLGSAPIG